MAAAEEEEDRPAEGKTENCTYVGSVLFCSTLSIIFSFRTDVVRTDFRT